jgi:hypothetical protein
LYRAAQTVIGAVPEMVCAVVLSPLIDRMAELEIVVVPLTEATEIGAVPVMTCAAVALPLIEAMPPPDAEVQPVAFPEARMPCASCPAGQMAGALARAVAVAAVVAVAALPVVF